MLALLSHMNMVNSAICSRCGDQDESFLHCVQDFRFCINIWQRIDFSSQPFFLSNSVTNWLKEGANCSCSTLVSFVGLWWLWKHRNLMCLSSETMYVTRLSCNIFSFAETIGSSLLTPARFIRWNNNSHMYTILSVDESCNGDPIRTSFEGFLRNNLGTYISGFSGFINNSQDILFQNLQHSIKVLFWKSA
jgi:hypothetical protein